MRKLILIVLILMVFGIFCLLIAISPAMLYLHAVSEGLDFDLIKIKKEEVASFRKGETFKIDRPDVEEMKQGSAWKVFHFSHYKMPFPFRHPMFLFIPLIQYETRPLSLGVKLLSIDRKKTFNTLLVKKPFKFVLPYDEVKLFTLPIFRNYISRKSQEEIWQDMFHKDTNILPENELNMFFTQKAPIFNRLKAILTISTTFWQLGAKKLVYRLFLLKLRNKYLPKNQLSSSYYSKKKLGIIELEYKDKNYRKEIVYLIENGIVYSIELLTHKWSLESKDFRNRFFSVIDYKEDSENQAELIYSEYKKLKYYERIDQEGMIFLYSAWSHVTENREFLREMIQFLERGKDNTIHLTPLYEYAYRKFGTTLSTKDELLKEDAESKLKRKMDEEIEEDMRKGASGGEYFEQNFESKEAREKYLLKKAKQDGEDIDISDDELVNE